MAPNPPSAHALVAHVLRRLTFGPTAELVDRFANGASTPEAAATAAIDFAIGAPARALTPVTVDRDGGWETSPKGWLENIRSADAGLHERMTWFWHGHFATSSDKVGNIVMMHNQQGLFRKHALGNFGTLLREISTDPAMLFYLDGAGSSVNAPNENYAREVMELFTLGRGNYTEADVKAGALALAGYEVDYESGVVKFNTDSALGGEVVFLNKRGRLNVDSVISALLDHPACAPHVASKLHVYLAGEAPSKERAAQLGDVFRSAGYEIAPLVDAIVRSPEFLTMRLNRPRYPIEWWVSAINAFGEFREQVDLNPWTLSQLDQEPYRPPNVAGWPAGPKWLSASQILARQAFSWNVGWAMRPLEGSNLVSAALRRCSIHECSDATRQSLRDAALATAGAADAVSVSRRIMTVALVSPEFSLV